MELIKKCLNLLNITTFLAAVIAIVLLSLVFAQGCATTGKRDINRVSYQVLQTSKSTYDLVTDSVNDLYKQKLIVETSYLEIEKYANRYMEAHNTAVDAVNAFKQGLMSADQVSGKVAAVTASLTALLRVAQPYILKLEKEGV